MTKAPDIREYTVISTYQKSRWSKARFRTSQVFAASPEEAELIERDIAENILKVRVLSMNALEERYSIYKGGLRKVQYEYEIMKVISDEMESVRSTVKDSAFDMGKYIALSEVQIELFKLFRKLEREEK